MFTSALAVVFGILPVRHHVMANALRRRNAARPARTMEEICTMLYCNSYAKWFMVAGTQWSIMPRTRFRSNVWWMWYASEEASSHIVDLSTFIRRLKRCTPFSNRLELEYNHCWQSLDSAALTSAYKSCKRLRNHPLTHHRQSHACVHDATIEQMRVAHQTHTPMISCHLIPCVLVSAYRIQSDIRVRCSATHSFV